MQNTFKINSQYNNLINLKVTPGHFATTSSHINYMIDLTTLKARCSEAKAVAKSMASEYIATTVVDAIVCMDGTDVIGAYLADELTNSGIMCMNQHQTIYVTTPEQNSQGQLLFKDNLIPMIKGKHVLLLLATTTTGQTIDKAIECITYYGGTIAGISAIFSATDEVQGMPIHAIFHSKDIEGYCSYPSHDCPLCKAGQKLDAIISAGGFQVIQ
ncbi:MAG: orotate phosphoribosyltransferase [Eubacterium sp.]|nr:orotate phosphoribosyltransferase [Eubacterium sp.]